MLLKPNAFLPALKITFFSIFLLNNTGTVYSQNNGTRVYFPQVYFDSADAVNRLQEGNSTISGVSFAKEGGLINGVKHYAARQTVVLFPFTEYFSEWYNLKYANPKANIIMIPQAFAQRLETKTDEYGNFSFKKMKPGKYYLECSINYTGTAVGKERVGTSTYYYGWNSYSYPVYESYYYNYNATQRANKVVEITRDGQLIEIKLRPNPFENFKSGKTASTDCYQINNKQYGQCKEFYKNGNLSVFAEWENGLFDGTCNYYFASGIKEAAGKYKKGFKVGNWKYYDSTGKISSEENYVYRDKMSVKEGAFTYFYTSGKTKAIYNYKDDKITGESFDYFDNGNIKGKYFYKNGLAEGEAVLYYESGNMKTKCAYKNNKLDGNAIYYTEKGAVEKTVVYNNGQLISEKKM